MASLETREEQLDAWIIIHPCVHTLVESAARLADERNRSLMVQRLEAAVRCAQS